MEEVSFYLNWDLISSSDIDFLWKNSVWQVSFSEYQEKEILDLYSYLPFKMAYFIPKIFTSDFEAIKVITKVKYI
jgi:hypothetical protein